MLLLLNNSEHIMSDEHIHTIEIKLIEKKYIDTKCLSSEIQIVLDGKVVPNVKRFAIDLDVESGNIHQPYLLEQYISGIDVNF